MTRSMTAYGRAHAETDAGLFLIEIQSVNRKNLDIHLNLPKEFFLFDIAFRQIITKQIYRGCILVRVSKEDRRTSHPIAVSQKVLKELHKSWQKYAKELGYEPKEAVSFDSLMSYALTLSSIENFNEQVIKKQLDKGFRKALAACLKMKEVEGNTLVKDILLRLENIEQHLNKIETYSKQSPKRYYDRLVKRLETIKISNEDDKERLLRELVIFSDKVDITEEVIRLQSHSKQFKAIIQEGKQCVGKELEFLLQEMNRESNTIAAKSQEIELTQNVFTIKSEQEKIREQLQNIE